MDIPSYRVAIKHLGTDTWASLYVNSFEKALMVHHAFNFLARTYYQNWGNHAFIEMNPYQNWKEENYYYIPVNNEEANTGSQLTTYTWTL